MSLEIFWGSGSAPSWRVLLTAAVKGVAYESRLLQFSKGEHKSPEYLAINPRGKVPAVRDGDLVLHESMAIMAWLDAKYPDPPIFGTTPAETGAIWCAMLESENHFTTAVTSLARPVLYNTPSTDDELGHAAAKVRDELSRLEATLATTPWVVGKRMTAADLSIFPVVQYFVRVATREKARPLAFGVAPLTPRYPHVAQWCARIETIPGYDRTYPPHWRE